MLVDFEAFDLTDILEILERFCFSKTRILDYTETVVNFFKEKNNRLTRCIKSNNLYCTGKLSTVKQKENGLK